MLPTPDLSHLTGKDYEEVYEPAEDTFALLDALEVDLEFIKGRVPNLALEIGSGSGCVTTFLAKALGPNSLLYCCTDINHAAASATQRTAAQNKVTLDVVQTSLVSSLDLRCRGAIDILLFNPPYVPTEDEEVSLAQDLPNISSSWAGGAYGMDITQIVLRQVGNLLSPKGCFYLVTISQNRPFTIMANMKESYGLDSKVILSRRAGREHLQIIRFYWPI